MRDRFDEYRERERARERASESESARERVTDTINTQVQESSGSGRSQKVRQPSRRTAARNASPIPDPKEVMLQWSSVLESASEQNKAKKQKKIQEVMLL